MNGLLKTDVVERLRQAGVVGAGGAGFPTWVKAGGQAEWVIANAAECEPLLRGNRELVAGAAGEVLRGLRIMGQVTGARRATIGIKAKYKEAVASLTEVVAAAPGSPAVDLHFLEDFYPAGDEHVLVYEITGRTIPPGGIPLKVGVVVNNVETLFNVAGALDGTPVISKYITVTGAVRSPVTLQAPLGTPFEDLLAKAGGPAVSDYAVLEGGPMMGRLAAPEAVVTKTTGGFIVLPVNHPLIVGRRAAIRTDLWKTRGMCCHCGYCTELCPRYLLGHSLRPDKTMSGIVYTAGETIIGGAAWLCSECGLCEAFACPMGLSPRRVNAWLKREMAAKENKATPGGSRGPHPARSYRMVPSARLIARLGLASYDRPAPFLEAPVKPRQVRLGTKQHLGRPATPLVKPGEEVIAGQIVADLPAGELGAPVHASIGGKVKYASPEMVVIESDGR